MADVNQPGIVQKVNVLCNKYNSSSMILKGRFHNSAHVHESKYLFIPLCMLLLAHRQADLIIEGFRTKRACM